MVPYRTSIRLSTAGPGTPVGQSKLVDSCKLAPCRQAGKQRCNCCRSSRLVVRSRLVRRIVGMVGYTLGYRLACRLGCREASTLLGTVVASTLLGTGPGTVAAGTAAGSTMPGTVLDKPAVTSTIGS
jgi:hypothetical protein